MDIKVVPYKDGRFCVVSVATGEVLDDAQGYGYRTAQKAHAGWAYKTRDTSKDAEKAAKKRAIKKWLKEHADFSDSLEDAAFQICKGSGDPDDKLNAAFVREMLADWKLTPPCTPGELLRVWQNG